jgi:primary-amine oxidase
MRYLLTVLTLLIFSISSGLASDNKHPLDPLTWQEHWATLEVLRKAGHVDSSTTFMQIRLQQPPKARVWKWKPGEKISRAAFVVLRNKGDSFEAEVDLNNRKLRSITPIEGAHTMWVAQDFGAGVEAAMSHPDFIDAMKKRGIEDFTFLSCVTIPPGYFGTEKEQGKRLGHLRCNMPTGVRNIWPRQIEGLTVVVDMDSGEILEVVDDGASKLHNTTADFDLNSFETLRDVPGPIRINQPDGPGFDVNGNQIAWQNWKFHVRVDQRTGTAISVARYTDQGEDRPIIYQANLSEIFVPYMDPDFAWHARNFIDAGEFSGQGIFKPLLKGQDCPEYALYRNSLNTGSNGRPTTINDTLCIFERDQGDPAWRHLENNNTASRPKRDLVVRSAAVIGNYDYLLDWIFQQDGSVLVAVGATGIVEVKMSPQKDASIVAKNKQPQAAADAYGRFIDPHIIAVNHDHYFSFRIDLDIDGANNSFVLDKLVQQKLEGDRRKSIWVKKSSVITSEANAKLNIDLSKPSLWRVLSQARKNHVGYPTSYQLRPGRNSITLLSEDDYPRRRAGFIDHHLWVTPHAPDERYAAGEYPTLSEPGEGLPAFTKDNRSIKDTDIVLWHTISMHHLVRAEDWPVMPVLWHSFELRPFDFFNGNPAMDLPPDR